MEATLDGVGRKGNGKNAARRLRRAGQVPAVVYGGVAQATETPQAMGIPIAVDPKALLKILHSESGANTLIGLQIDGGAPSRVMVKEFQLDPVTHRLLHADFYRVAMDKRITITVPITIKGEARGVKLQAGILDFVHRDVEIECLPGEIPEHIEVDVTELMIGQGVRLRDVCSGVTWAPVSDLDTLLVHVIAPMAEEAPPAAAEAVVAPPAEPEVIKKGKVEKPEVEE